MKKIAIVLACATVLSGCAQLQSKFQAKHTSLPITSPYTAELTYPAVDASGRETTVFEIANAITNGMQKKSGYKKLDTYYSNGSQIGDVRGLSLISSGTQIQAQYSNGERYNSTGRADLTITSGISTLHGTTNNGRLSVQVKAPSIIETTGGRNSLYMSIAPLLSDQDAYNDIVQMLKNNAPSLERSYPTSGEFNVKYNDVSVYANFKRILGTWKDKQTNSKDDIRKAQRFTLTHNNKRIPVEIEVYPYRNGSKVVYRYEVPYALKPDGTSTFSKNTEKALSNKIKAVANS